MIRSLRKKLRALLPLTVASALLCPGVQAGISLGLSTTSYMNPVGSSLPASFQSLETRGRIAREGPRLDYAAQWLGTFTFGPQADLSADISELYLRNHLAPGQHVRLTVGRKLETWSVLDDQWSLGIWQPEFRRDYLAPAQAGLAGVFLELLPEGPFKITAFGSPGFIPERGVPIEQRDGTLSSHSPWFVSPPTHINYGSHVTPLQYELEVPRLSELLAHPGGALMLSWGRSEGAWTSAAYAYKPINRLLLGYDGNLQLSEDPIAARAELFPRVLYHHVASLQGGYRGRGFGATLSVLGEKPIRDKTPESWTTQEISPALAVSSSLEASPWGERGSSIGLSYLRQWGGNEADSGPFATPGVSSFESRWPYQSALALDLKVPYRRFIASSRMLHDFVNEGTIIRAELRYRPDARWTMALGADLLGSSGNGDGVTNGNFISTYRSNDRVHGGLSYAF